MASLIINISLVGFMLVIALMILSSRRLFAVIVMSGAYSLISAAMFINLDAVDVAFTEAAVGAGFTTVLFMAAMAWLPAEEKRRETPRIFPPVDLFCRGGVADVGGELSAGTRRPQRRPASICSPALSGGKLR